jgi:hypothetical protein
MSGQHGNSLTPRGANKPMTPAALAETQLKWYHSLFWVVWNIATLGAPWLLKILIAKAVTEALVMHDRVTPYPAYLPAPVTAPAYATETQRGMYPEH